MARFLVTGGCGFIGSHLCEALLAHGYGVHVLDDLSTGTLTNLAPGATLRIGSVEDPNEVARAMEGVDGCFHLAAIASVARCNGEWLASHRTNLSGAIAVLDAARACAWDAPIPVVYASSAAVYGAAAASPLEEDAVPRPISAYGADKLGCELHARVAGQVHGVPTLGLRFFNVFGPRQDPGSPYSGVISIFCDRLAAGQPVTIQGDGGQTRDFIFVEDVVAALIRGMALASPAAPVLNVCTGQAISVLQLAHLVAEACGTLLGTDYAPVRPGDIRHSVGSPRLAREAGLPPPAALEEGLGKVIAWLRAGSPGLSPLLAAAMPVPAAPAPRA
jgi:UDP-glucose 4-epimerase